jgi:hypothetical protein
MSIQHVNITNDRENYCVHLEDEEPNFLFLVPIEKDSSENWARLQEWLDAGNTIANDMSNQDTYYYDMRRVEYPSIHDQLDTLYHHGLDAWKAQIKEVKDKYPKP